jgi:hypothetical protein
MEVGSQLHFPATLPLGKDSVGTHWIGGGVGPGAVLDAVVKRNKSHTLLGIEPRLSSP